VLTARVARAVRSPERAACRDVCGDRPSQRRGHRSPDHETALEALYHTSAVPYGPDGEQIKRYLVHCLEIHHGDLSTAVVQPDEALLTLRTIAELTEEVRRAIRGAFCPAAVGTDLCIPGSGMSGSGPTAPDALLHPIREDP
jgi:hypothetical protein